MPDPVAMKTNSFLCVATLAAAEALSCSSLEPAAPIQGAADASYIDQSAEKSAVDERGSVSDAPIGMPEDASIDTPPPPNSDVAASDAADAPPVPVDVSVPEAGPGLSVHACSGVVPFLKTNGLNVRTGRGTGPIVTLRGVNLGGWLMIEPYMTPCLLYTSPSPRDS